MDARDKGDVLLEETWERLVGLAQHADRSLKIRKRCQAVRQLAIEYPMATVCMAVFLTLCSLPVVCFITFAAVSTVVAFCGFLLIEGIDRYLPCCDVTCLI